MQRGSTSLLFPSLESILRGVCVGRAYIGIFFIFHFCSRDQMKARITSSRHGLYKLGYTFATMKILETELYIYA